MSFFFQSHFIPFSSIFFLFRWFCSLYSLVFFLLICLILEPLIDRFPFSFTGDSRQEKGMSEVIQDLDAASTGVTKDSRSQHDCSSFCRVPRASSSPSRCSPLFFSCPTSATASKTADGRAASISSSSPSSQWGRKRSKKSICKNEDVLKKRKIPFRLQEEAWNETNRQHFVQRVSFEQNSLRFGLLMNDQC